MPIDVKHLRDLVIRPTLEYLHPEIPLSEAAVQLLLGTAAQESHMGTYLRQLGGGPALGIYQMEPRTFEDHRKWLFASLSLKRVALQTKVLSGLASHWTDPIDNLIGNLPFATALARIHYFRCPEKLPSPDDLPGLAALWKKRFNTNLGKGTVDEFVANFERYVK